MYPDGMELGKKGGKERRVLKEGGNPLGRREWREWKVGRKPLRLT